ncbi:putative disease resistance RPP13-like protein 1 isoform X1 [Morus notabilis]|uniref:putative disease resistance RPP13-like protein 1 isoform X1 n=1 Tax=Morus notabilis TaxID=981085 RepID=UPI000CED4AF1|nr:putative disease resistance RPP13-like protein 1 isoform X1 [Morus notabilis]XP_024017696.1 putative disease resistance RPP13-like protein 1 isoform X1 [Morus notabilis]XP_024017697.1 putative disease resistance RPP13-like protein 1 isoform X1 [Morus notabilis]XP_024017698.1 putative disease resistance RPP13-like protein 1 isoform X1 [Morus notabilis]
MGNVPTHHLGEVSDDDCWKLFEKHVFINGARSEAYQELHAIGRDIVEKCKGVPLAVKSLAGLLRSVVDPEEWREILNSDIWELQLQGNQSNILPSLWLSYHYLPSHLKKCFVYCSIFPKDYVMNEYKKKKEIILLWMAEGLLQSGRRGKRIEDVGNEYFQDLISRSLFQPLSEDKSTILMHDLTHDLAIFVSGEFSCRLDEGDKAKFSGKTRHVSYSKTKDLESFEGLSLAKSLRTFIQSGSLDGTFSISMPQLERLLSIGGCLRALCLSNLDIIILPDSIGNLKHLRYLDLSWNDNIKEIPNTLCGLYNLQTLRLSWCGQLTRLPNDMGNLVNLRHLEIEGVPLEEMPPMMRNMKDLQTLCYFVLCKRRGSSIKELGGLRYLSGELEIRKLENVEVVEDVVEANLRDKRYLNKLVYRWSSDDAANESTRHGEVLDALQPHTNVKELRIEGYGGETFSNWVGHRSYTNMVTVCLSNCHHCCLLPPFGQLPSLQNLKIYYCRGVVRIGAEFYGDGSSNTKPFRSLKFLEFKNMSAWEEWSIPEGREDEGCFPSLESLHILDCFKIGRLPDYLPSLKILRLRKCPARFLGRFPSTSHLP